MMEWVLESSLLWLGITITAFLLGSWLNIKARRNALVNPALISIFLVCVALVATGVSHDEYFASVSLIHFLLGPATVALAIPLYDQFAQIRRLLVPIMVACLCGLTVCAVSAVAIGMYFDQSRELLISLAPKSVTTPIAMGISETLGGLGSLTAALVIITGVSGSIVGPLVLKLIREKDENTQGFTMGLVAHGFGTAYAFSISPAAGAFAGLAMGLTGLFSAFLLPLFLQLMGV
ncbi:LrgB family protein [Desulfurispirillum indicum]|uniref:LrgB family protein n=1 Tax=Desulfurispirillum indicum TaxID=936456 RepID=UPI001CFBA00E|nr:LrgB family protein [Desulfurispirillum indicum]UCZ56799.1 LrgB family protein [Desulfurispirillum indicum]